MHLYVCSVKVAAVVWLLWKSICLKNMWPCLTEHYSNCQRVSFCRQTCKQFSWLNDSIIVLIEMSLVAHYCVGGRGWGGLNMSKYGNIWKYRCLGGQSDVCICLTIISHSVCFFFMNSFCTMVCGAVHHSEEGVDLIGKTSNLSQGCKFTLTVWYIKLKLWHKHNQ